MAVNFEDLESGFRHREVVRFINEEVLLNGGNSGFYQACCLLPWNKIEDELLNILTDPQVPRTKQRAFAWSALALRVRVAARKEEQQAHCIQKLQEELQKRRAATWALASQLRQLRQERQMLIAHLRFASNNRQQSLNKQALHGQLLQTNRQPAEAAPGPGDPQLATEGCSVNAEERNEVLAAARSQSEQLMVPQWEETQIASATGLLCLPRPQTWGLDSQPSVAVSLPMRLPVAFPYAHPRPPRLVSGAKATFPPQMPTGGIYPAGVWPAVGTREEVALQGDQGSQGQEEGPVRSHLLDPSGRSWSLGEQKSQGQMPCQPRAPGTLCEAEKAPDPVWEGTHEILFWLSAAFTSVRPQLAGAKKNVKKNQGRGDILAHTGHFVTT